ncbi:MULTISPECIES: hypothetical protein [unclassified Pseudomonas]
MLSDREHLPGEPSCSEHFYSICPFIDWPADQVPGTEATRQR